LTTPRHFFFYGTLRRGLGNDFTRDIFSKFEFVETGTVSGRLFLMRGAIGPYPMLVPGRGRVKGDLCRMLPGFSACDLTRLDAYEDYYPDDPARSRYLREIVTVSLAPGRRVSAWRYVRNGKPPRGAPLIASGDFAQWMHGHRDGSARPG